MRLSPALLAIVCAVHPLPALAQASDTDAQAIRQVVEEAYVRGVFINRDPAAVRAGFHNSTPDHEITRCIRIGLI